MVRLPFPRRVRRFAALSLAAAGWALAAAAFAADPAPPGAPDPTRDAEIESFLLRGRVVEAKPIGSGITRPFQLLLEHEGRTMKAAFKTVEIAQRKGRVLPGYPAEQEFTDQYRYERAAYLVDRELGLGMVPVAVLRSWDQQEGAAIAWISGAIDEFERRERDLDPPDRRSLKRQLTMMHVFDALILNTDRTQKNQLITLDDWKLHLIDHSRSFRLSHHLPDHFVERPAQLPRRLLERLEALDEKRLQELLRGVISRARVRALMARRDRILAKIGQDRRRFGDGFVFNVDFVGPEEGGAAPAAPADGGPVEDL